MPIQDLEGREVLRRLATSESGLAEEEARRRLAEFGPNEIAEVRGRPLYLKFLGQFTHFLAVLLWIAAGLAFFSEYMHPGEGMLHLGSAIVVVILINGLFTFVQEYRAERAVEALRKLLPFFVRVMRDGEEKEIDAREIVPGDLILLGEGDRVPADARLIEATGLKVNNAPLTGESEPAARSAAPFGGEFLESPNIVFASSTVLSGSARAVVFSTGTRTELGRIAHLAGVVSPGLSPLQREIVKVARLVAAIAAAMGAVFFAAGHFAGRTFWENYLFAIGIIVANVPEGLLPTVTLALAMGSQRMAKRKALVKTLTSVETLGSVTVICTDKTGTLTENRMKAKALWAGGKAVPMEAASGLGGSPEETGPAAGLLMKIALLCNNARSVEGELRGDPTEVALLEAALKFTGGLAAERLMEMPFDSERKMMTTVNLLEGRKLALTKGALERVLPLSSRILLEEGEAPLGDALREEVTRASHAMMEEGMRVLAFAFRDVSGAEEPEKDMVFVGLIGLEDPPRPEVPEAVRKCRSAGIRIIMITGDATRTALAIARQIGLSEGDPVAIEAHEFQRMRDSELKERLKAPGVMFTRMTPKHKLRVVSLLKEEGERVAVTGDGVNDAPALKQADIGIAMGITGTDVAKEAADIVLLDDNFATIVSAVEEGRAVYENIKKFISYIFSSNIPEIVPYLAYVLFRVPLPLTIMQILAVDLGTDMLPALALGAEKPGRDLMERPPRKPGERLLSAGLLSRAYLFLGPIEAAAALFGFFYVLRGGGWQWGEALGPHDPLYMRATTACLAAIVVTQAANVFACRSMRESALGPGFFSNRLIFWGIAVEAALIAFIAYHPWGWKIFSTAPLPPEVWLVLVPFALALLLAEEARKLMLRRFGRRLSGA